MVEEKSEMISMHSRHTKVGIIDVIYHTYNCFSPNLERNDSPRIRRWCIQITKALSTFIYYLQNLWMQLEWCIVK